MAVSEKRINEHIVAQEDAGKRIDVYLSEKLPITRSALKHVFSSGAVRLNGEGAKTGHRLKPNDVVTIVMPEKTIERISAQDLPIKIVYEDDDIVIVNKPAGLAVHPGAGRRTGTLVNALLFHVKKLSNAGDADRPGIVHRLDKDTSGLLVVAKNNESYFDLVRQFKDHTTSRKYAAIVWGDVLDDEGVINTPIGRDIKHRQMISTRSTKTRAAVTHYKVVKRYGALTMLELTLETGRTHQIRVHLASIKHPVACDPVYGKRKVPSTLPKLVQDALKMTDRQLLHARTLAIHHPRTKKRRRWTTVLPKDMQSIVDALDKTMASPV